MKTLACWAALALFALLALSPASGHLSHDTNIRIERGGDRIKLSLMVEGRDLAQFDASGDGRLTPGEFTDELEDIAAAIDSCLDARDAADRPLPLTRADHPVPDFAQLGAHDTIERLRVLRQWRLPAGTRGRIDFGCFLNEHAEKAGLVLEGGRAKRVSVSRARPLLWID